MSDTIEIKTICKCCGSGLESEIVNADVNSITVSVDFCEACHEELNEGKEND